MNPRHDVPPEVNDAVGMINRQATAIQVLLAALFIAVAVAVVGWVRDVPPPEPNPMLGICEARLHALRLEFQALDKAEADGQQELSTCLADNARLAKQLSQ
jgi:hypothetical protein